jgi:DNA invertase Pin-like site-specific DNA recombinase
VADGAPSGDDPSAVFMRDILLAVARLEKALIRARIKAALAVKRSRGDALGNCPFGFTKTGSKGKLVPHPEEASVVERIRALRASGLTLRGVQAAALQEGLRGRSGQPLTLALVHSVCSASASPCL